MHDYIEEMLDVACILMSLLENGSTINMQFAIHTLDLLWKNHRRLKAERLEELINKRDPTTDVQICNDPEFEDACKVFKELYKRFVGTDGKDGDIEKIIDKYKDMVWNCLNESSTMLIFYTDNMDISEPLNWLKEKHILHAKHELKADNETVSLLKDIAGAPNPTLDDFFGVHVQNDEWIMNNIEKIKAPIIVKQNDVSLYSPENTLYYEFVQIGFDEEVLTKKLQL